MKNFSTIPFNELYLNKVINENEKLKKKLKMIFLQTEVNFLEHKALLKI